MQDKFCINCKHHEYGDILDKCKQFIDYKDTDKVTGVTITIHSSCVSIRNKDNECGYEGNLFEPTFKYKVISIIKGVFK